MKLKSVKKYRNANYPDRSTLRSNPQLINGAVPQRWLKKGLTTGTLLMLVGSCDQGWHAATQGGGPQTKRDPSSLDHQARHEGRAHEFKMPPLFIHGDGHGATGCVVVTPPVFLSEDEAIDLIINELRNSGFSPSDKPLLLDGVLTEERREKYDRDRLQAGRAAEYEKGQKHLFYLDGYDSNRGIGFKFVSSENYEKLGGPSSDSTVMSYDMVAVAQEIRERLAGEPVSAVVFYDPIIQRDGCRRGECEAEARELLKEQVRDFVEWSRRESAQE
ncbi:MAG: hypothetical protein AB1714_17885 [Acidobacteriota bacterium]